VHLNNHQGMREFLRVCSVLSRWPGLQQCSLSMEA
jgi:hypothetical protein